MKKCIVCKNEIVSGESYEMINESYYHTNGFCDSVISEKIDGSNGESKQLNESLGDLEDYQIL